MTPGEGTRERQSPDWLRGARLLTLCALALLTACTPSRPLPISAGPSAEQVRQAQGRTQAAMVECDVRVAPANSEAQVAKVRLWADRDGRLRAGISRLDAPVADLLVERDGRYRIVAWRSNLSATGTLGASDTPPALRGLRQLADQALDGAVPAGDLASEAGYRLTSATYTVEFDPATLDVARVISASATVAYSRHQDHDGLRRAGRVSILTADGDQGTVLVRRFEALASIPASQLRLVPPADARAVPASVLLEHLE